MCGRYTLRASRKQIAETFEAHPVASVPELFERYNLAPQQDAPIVWQDHEGRVVAMARWGLVPAWAKDPKQLKSTPINARADRIAASPMFKHALRRRRCLVPATGFYEWQQQGQARSKQPYHIKLKDGGLFAFAGLWERWRDEAGDTLDTFTLVTTDANELVEPVHNRMPVILPHEAWRAWLDPHLESAKQLADMLKPPPTGGWEAMAVSRHVNSPANDDPACIEPLSDSNAQSPPLTFKRNQRRLF